MALSVTCPSCGKSFQLAQEIYDRKVAGKVVSIKCKQCQSGIRIDATKPGELKVLGASPAAGATETTGVKNVPTDSGSKAQNVRPQQPTLIGMMGAGGQPITHTSDAPIEGALWAV